jgi:hypothetical protein
LVYIHPQGVESLGSSFLSSPTPSIPPPSPLGDIRETKTYDKRGRGGGIFHIWRIRRKLK